MRDREKSSREVKTRADLGDERSDAKRVAAPGCLVVIYGPELGRRALVGTAPFEIGRASRADLTIDQESVSRSHARITWNEREHIVEDQNSTNGVFVNDIRAVRVPLAHGDQLKVGRAILKYMRGDDLEASYHEEIYRIMTSDALTGAHNRRFLLEALGREFNRAMRYRRTLALVVFDIDRMGVINERFGAVAGDSVIRQLAQSILPRTREQDVMARLGGQEFALLLPEIDRAGAGAVAEKIRRIAESARFSVEGKTFGCTVSLGVAALDKSTESADALLTRASAGLTRAKKQGRNRVESG